jgi:hypothetical protein
MAGKKIKWHTFLFCHTVSKVECSMVPCCDDIERPGSPRMLLKAFCLAILLISSLGTANAQYKPVQFGLRIGGNIDWIDSDSEGYEYNGLVPGFSWGFESEFFMMEHYAILTGLNVNYLGGKLEYPDTRDITNDTVPAIGILSRQYHLRYIEIPLCLKMQTEIVDKIRIFGKIGLGTGFNIKALADDTFTYDGGQLSTRRDAIDGEIAMLRESLIIGFGAEFILKGSTALMVDLTLNGGFINILKGTNTVNPEVDQSANLNFIEVGTGIFF